MELNFALTERDLAAAERAVGEHVQYCVPADLSLTGRRMKGFLVIGNQKWAYIENGEVIESCHISDYRDYRVVPMIGNALLEAVDSAGTTRIVVRLTMQHVARYAYIAKILNDIASNREVRIYNQEEETNCPNCGAPFVPGTRICRECMSKTAALKRIFKVAVVHWRWLLLGLITLFATSAISLSGPYFQKILVNEALAPVDGSADLTMFWIAIAGLAFVLVASEFLTIGRGRIMATVSSKVAASLRQMVYEKVQQLSLGFLTSQRAGDIMNRVTQDTNRIQNLIQEVFTTAVFQLTILVAASTLMFRTDWLLALIVILPAPFVANLQVQIWRKKLRKLFHKQYYIGDKANSFLHDILSGIRVVKAFGKEEHEIGRFRKYNHDFKMAAIRAETVYSYLAPISHYLIQLGLYMVYLVGGMMILDNQLTIGELVQFAAYATMIYGPLQWLMNMPRWIANAAIAIERVFSVIDETPEIVDRENAVRHAIQGEIRFNNVTFGYKSYEPVLKNINVEIKKGEMVGLVGHSGAGKSTMINLISRFYDVNEGSITIDGVDIRDILQEDLRSQISVVLQETFLFGGSILDNIRYSKPEATLEEVIRAAKIANAHDFIIRLPDGYDTRLDENGSNLSGGERQRLAIARAVLNDPRILILDEATASLDIETETVIQEALKRVTENRTTIAIAHRLATLRNANRLFVLKNGEIVEIGTHDELMERRGIYYGLIMAQRQMSKPRKEQEQLA